MYPTIKNPRSRAHSIFFALIVLVYSGAAPAGAPIPDFFNVTPELPANSVHSTTDLNNIFNTGVGPYTPAMAGKIYPYPLTIGGVKTNPIYNGCYDRQNRLLGPLDANNSCAAVVAANPNSAIYSLFLGYKIACPGGAAGGICGDTELSMNCQYTQVQAGTSPFDNAAVSTRICSTERGIVRRALGNGTTVSAYVGCHPGEDGTTYPTCNPCAVGTFNPSFDPNTVACTACSTLPLPPNAAASPLIAWTSPAKSFDPTACIITGGLNCNTGYSVSTDKQSCTQNAPTCTLKITLAPTNPSFGAADGSIVASYSMATGTVPLGLTITAPTAKNPTTGGTGSPATFSGLSGGAFPGTTYTVSATDSVCTQTANVTLIDSPAPSPLPSPTPCTLNIALTGTNPTSSASTNGSYSGTITGAMGPLSVTVGSTYAVPPSNPPVTAGTATTTASSLPAGYYSVTVLDSGTSCSITKGVNLTAPAPPSCAIGLTLTGTNPSGSTTTDGTIAATTSGAVGSVKIDEYGPTGYGSSINGSSGTFSGLAGGVYTITANDLAIAGCSTTKSITLTQPACTAAVTLAVTGSNPSTNAGTDGSVTVNLAGGVAPFTIEVFSSDGLAGGAPVVGSSTSHTYTGLRANSYTAQVWDANGNPGCSATKYITLTDPPVTCGMESCPSGGSNYFFSYTQDVNQFNMNGNPTTAARYSGCRDPSGNSYDVLCSTSGNTSGLKSCTAAVTGQQYYTLSSQACLY